MKPSLVSFL